MSVSEPMVPKSAASKSAAPKGEASRADVSKSDAPKPTESRPVGQPSAREQMLRQLASELKRCVNRQS